MRKSEYNKLLCERVRALRIASGRSQVEMARALGVEKGTYATYELRSPMPHFLLARFAAIVKVDPGYLLTGQQPSKGASASRAMPSAPAEAAD